MTVLLALLAAILFACGTWLLMQRRLARIIVGVGLLGHGANLLLVTAGDYGGRAPIIGGEGGGVYSDPLPQALALTAIVITFGVTAFLLALGFRSWQITGDDAVEDDVEDRVVARLNQELPAATTDDPPPHDSQPGDAGPGDPGPGDPGTTDPATIDPDPDDGSAVGDDTQSWEGSS